MKFQTYEQLRLACILRKCLILVGNWTEYSYSCSHSQYTVYGAYHSSMSCLKVSSSFPPMPRQLDVWTVSNFTVVLLSFKLLHSKTEVPFTVLAIYSLRSGTLKRVNGDATRAVCRLRIDVSEALYAIPCDTIQYNTIQYNTIQYNTIQYNTIQYNTIQYNTIQYNTIQNNTIQYNTIQYNTIQYNTIQYNTIQYNTIQYNTIQYNTIKTLLSRTGKFILQRSSS